MLDYLQRKLLNVLVLFRLVWLNSHYPFTAKAVERIQEKQLKKLIRRASTFEFYQKRFATAGVDPTDIKTPADLHRLPVLRKDELREWVQSEYEKNPERYKHWFRDSTSGSTGAPLVIYLSGASRANANANWIREAMVHGFRLFRDSTLSIISPHRVKQRDSIIQSLGIMRRYQVSQLAPAGEMAEAMNREKPDFMYANKSQLMQMAIYAREKGITIHHPKLYAGGAESMSAQERAFIEDALGPNLYETYGTVETGSMAFEPPGEKGRFMLNHDTHILWLMGEDGNPSDKGRAIITVLQYRGFPIINYDIGDYMETVTENGLPYVTKLKGRLDDWAVFSNGERLPFHYFYEALCDQPSIRQFRVIQEDLAHFTILLSPHKDRPVDVRETENAIWDHLDKNLRHPEVTFAFEWVDRIPTDSTGKIRIFVSKVPPGDITG